MPRIVVVGTAPLLVEGTRAALAGVAGWDAVAGTAGEPADAGAARLRAAVGAVLEGLAVRESPWPTPPPEHEPLTAREVEVFEFLAKGLSNREIGGVLGISSHTAKYHVAQILAKMGAATRAEAVHAGLRAGLIGL